MYSAGRSVWENPYRIQRFLDSPDDLHETAVAIGLKLFFLGAQPLACSPDRFGFKTTNGAVAWEIIGSKTMIQTDTCWLARRVDMDGCVDLVTMGLEDKPLEARRHIGGIFFCICFYFVAQLETCIKSCWV